MSFVTDLSVNSLNRFRFCSTVENVAQAIDNRDITESDGLAASSDSAAVSFRQVNNENKLKSYLASNNSAAFIEQQQSIGARVKLVAQSAAVAYSEISESVESDSQPNAETDTQLALLGKAFEELEINNLQSGEINRVAALSAGTSTASSKEISAAVSEAIGAMSESYLDVFQQAVEKNITFYTDFTDFIATLSSYISADGDKTVFAGDKFGKALDELRDKYPVPSVATTLFPTVTDGTLKGTTKEECTAWAKMMGLDANKSISQLEDGTYIVNIDISPLDKIAGEVPKNLFQNSYVLKKFNSAEWAAWQAGLDIQKDTIQTSMQTLTQRYSNANSTFDNLVKVLSSVINSLLDSDRSFFNI